MTINVVYIEDWNKGVFIETLTGHELIGFSDWDGVLDFKAQRFMDNEVDDEYPED